MDIMDMTLRQILQAIPHHPVKAIVYLLVADNILITACAQMGWVKAETVLMQVAKFLTIIIKSIATKSINIPKGPVAPMVILALFLCAPMARAQSADALQVSSSILDKFVLSPGIAYSTKTKNLVNTETVKAYQFTKPSGNRFLNLLSTFNVSLDTGFGTPNRYVLGGSLSLLKAMDYGITLPVLKYIEIRPQVLYSISFIDPSNLTNAKKEWIYGISIMSVKF